jgi:DNA-directed RNA polymerase subunit RPC12/RpoP
MEEIKVACSCGKNYRVKRSLEGKKIRCPDCQSILTVEPEVTVVEAVMAEDVQPVAFDSLVFDDPIVDESSQPSPKADAFWDELPGAAESVGSSFDGFPSQSPGMQQTNFASPNPGPTHESDTKRIAGADSSMRDVQLLITKTEKNTGPWRHGSFLVIQGSERLPQRCVKTDAPGEIENHQNVRYFPVAIMATLMIFTAALGGFGYILGLWLISRMAGESDDSKATIRYWMTESQLKFCSFQVAVAIGIAILGVFALFAFAAVVTLAFLISGIEIPAIAGWLWCFFAIACIYFGGALLEKAKPLVAHKVDPTSRRVWLTGASKDFLKRLPELPAAPPLPMRLFQQRILAFGVFMLVVSPFAVLDLFTGDMSSRGIAKAIGDPNELFDLEPLALKRFPDLPKPEIVGSQKSYRIDLGVSPGTSGEADKLYVVYPSQVAKENLGCVLMTNPGGTSISAGASIDDYSRAVAEFVKAGFVVVVYECDGRVFEKMRVRDFQAAYSLYAQSRAGLVNAVNALNFVVEKLPSIDKRKIYTYGHSSAGTLALLLASHDSRIAACVAVCE